MKKIFFISCIVCLVLFYSNIFLNINSTLGKEAFINSFWNTLDFGDNDPLTDWSEAGKLDFFILGYTGALYIKNDYNDLLLGILILGDISENWTCRINFDVDADRGWAEDAKELTFIILNGENDFLYKDQYYIQNQPSPIDDPDSPDFTASYRTFSAVGNDYIIFELSIPFQTTDLLKDLQVYEVETSIIGISMDFYNMDSNQNSTWYGGTFPDYADASNYLQILFAGPQDRKIPIFEEETPPTSGTTTKEETTKHEDYGDYASASPSFELTVGFVALCTCVLVLRMIFRKEKK